MLGVDVQRNRVQRVDDGDQQQPTEFLEAHPHGHPMIESYSANGDNS